MTNFVIDLILWYKANRRELPWRKTKEAYYIWISEIILQQTRVSQGLSYYLHFVELFPTVHHLAEASEDMVLKCWQGLGYYSRARNMHAAAKFVSQELKGVFPTSYDGLLQLKGVGTYTAAAISSICYNEYRTVVDGNVFRVLTRIYGIETPVNTAAGKKEIEQLAHELNVGEDKGTFNQALMEFGALHCTPRLPGCATCIFEQWCWARKNNKVDALPVKEKKLKIKHRYLYYIYIHDKRNQTLIQRRNGKDIWKGLYQFPLVEFDKELSVSELLLTGEFANLMGKQRVKIISEQKLKHQLTHRLLHITIVDVELDSLKHLKHADYQLVDCDDLAGFAFPKPLSTFVDER